MTNRFWGVLCVRCVQRATIWAAQQSLRDAPDCKLAARVDSEIERAAVEAGRQAAKVIIDYIEEIRAKLARHIDQHVAAVKPNQPIG